MSSRHKPAAFYMSFYLMSLFYSIKLESFIPKYKGNSLIKREMYIMKGLNQFFKEWK